MRLLATTTITSTFLLGSTLASLSRSSIIGTQAALQQHFFSPRPIQLPLPQIRTMFSKHSLPDGKDLPKGKSQQEWRTVLSPAQFKVLREAGTERAFTHEYENNSKEGVYNCAACETPLYKSTTKFKSGCGWPAFFDAIPGAVKRNVDKSLGMKRIEIRCAACDSHLGHVFEGEGFNTPTDERHCVNGISLRFNDEKEKV